MLNLEGCRGLVLGRFNRNSASNQVLPGFVEPISPMIRNCAELVEVNFGSTGLSYNSISFLADKLTTKVTKSFSVKSRCIQRRSYFFPTLDIYYCCDIDDFKKVGVFGEKYGPP